MAGVLVRACEPLAGRAMVELGPELPPPAGRAKVALGPELVSFR
jgi:hypothetical protein